MIPLSRAQLCQSDPELTTGPEGVEAAPSKGKAPEWHPRIAGCPPLAFALCWSPHGPTGHALRVSNSARHRPGHILVRDKGHASEMGVVDMTQYLPHWPSRAPCPPVVVTDLVAYLMAVKDAVWRAGIQKGPVSLPAPSGAPRTSSKTAEHDGAESWYRDGQRRISTV